MADLILQVDKASFAAFVKDLKATVDDVRAAANVAVWQAAQKVLSDAKERCPVDTGALRASGTVDPAAPNQHEPHPEATVGFGGPSVDYALIVHERTDVHHPVGEAKYLENALNAYSGDFLSDAAAVIRERIGDRKR